MISSAHNQQIKDLMALMEKSRKRREEGVFVLEGVRESRLALEAGYRFRSLYYCPDILPNPREALSQLSQTVKPIPIEAGLYRNMTYRGSTEGLLSIVETPSRKLSDLKISSNPFIIILESVEKPGNLGAVLRSADAAHVDALIICDPLTDLYNPNVIRSSVGCIFTVPTAVCSNPEALAWLQERNISPYAATLQDSIWYHTIDFTQASAIVMGTEDKGLGHFWRENSKACIKIPMRGAIDSLNVSVSTAVICFEAMRQRGFGL